MNDFQTYLPETWFEEGLEIASKPSEGGSEESRETRSTRWSVDIPTSVLIGGAISLSALVFSVPASASSLSSLVVPVTAPGFAATAGGDKNTTRLSPLKQINRDFNTLFEAMRDGRPIARSVDLREVARSAVAYRNKNADSEAWAEQLASDTKDADD